MQKTCFKCLKSKDIDDFYCHPKMSDGHLNKCKECTKIDSSTGNYKVECKVCKKIFFTTKSEFTSRKGKRGTGRKTCSRECWYKWSRGDNKYNWKGENVGYTGLHHWIKKQLGSPNYCELCKTSDKNIKYHWSNKSGRYLRDVTDWQRLCVSCHSKYDSERREYIKINCIVCNKTVVTKSKKRKFCSNHCSSIYYRMPSNTKKP